ncbi:unannotated protein [freshwater metagenome]|uniref:Unannotated protein n=1 Tax=freshwater metagenome TaxID=449393 RepID=A0A6J6XH06_9ZZZZ
MKVNLSALRQLVRKRDPDLVAGVDLNHRAGDCSVIRPRTNCLAGLDLPINNLGSQFELFGSVWEKRRLERDVADALGIRAICELPYILKNWLELRFVVGVVRGALCGLVVAHAAGHATLPDRDSADHPGASVAWDSAVHLIGAVLESL